MKFAVLKLHKDKAYIIWLPCLCMNLTASAERGLVFPSFEQQQYFSNHCASPLLLPSHWLLEAKTEKEKRLLAVVQYLPKSLYIRPAVICHSEKFERL